jgi:NAD(P)-dependent dehydrogenase (short-subunit alcohol dehydrogenase family)
MTFSNKLALVTGGSSGIGLAIADRLVKSGARVIITGRDAAKLEQARQTLGTAATAHVVDVTKVADIDRLMADVKRDHGKLDTVVANAGATTLVPVGALTEAHVDEVIGANLKGVIFTVQQALPLMGAGGNVVIIGSTASILPPPGMSVYGAAKAALRALVKGWVQELNGRDIRINLVSPGPVHTPGLEKFFAGEQGDAMLAELVRRSTVGRIGFPHDVAAAVAFLASDEAGYINGVELFVDGGAA